MCPRSIVVIPGLLKKLSAYEKRIDELEAVRAKFEWFYDVNWTRPMEKTFVSVIVEQIELGLEERGFPDPCSIRQGFHEVNCVYRKTFEFNHYEDKRKHITMAYVDLVDPAWDELAKIFTYPEELEVAENADDDLVPDEGVSQDFDVISLSPTSENDSDEI
ncbi:hypothetical protein Salat_1193600 [Sesamum alatum]|uniref:Uncharacterized protein n=1 Tax=Sesamum alatum TaxID=300844 RepID=A0AAE1YER7_9LAMI|nr:hypothetical protein Salat_1193600 [Sesamum alatum]